MSLMFDDIGNLFKIHSHPLEKLRNRLKGSTRDNRRKQSKGINEGWRQRGEGIKENDGNYCRKTINFLIIVNYHSNLLLITGPSY